MRISRSLLWFCPAPIRMPALRSRLICGTFCLMHGKACIRQSGSLGFLPLFAYIQPWQTICNSLDREDVRRLHKTIVGAVAIGPNSRNRASVHLHLLGEGQARPPPEVLVFLSGSLFSREPIANWRARRPPTHLLPLPFDPLRPTSVSSLVSTSWSGNITWKGC